jgi:hypothetical protein
VHGEALLGQGLDGGQQTSVQRCPASDGLDPLFLEHNAPNVGTRTAEALPEGAARMGAPIHGALDLACPVLSDPHLQRHALLPLAHQIPYLTPLQLAIANNIVNTLNASASLHKLTNKINK